MAEYVFDRADVSPEEPPGKTRVPGTRSGGSWGLDWLHDALVRLEMAFCEHHRIDGRPSGSALLFATLALQRAATCAPVQGTRRLFIRREQHLSQSHIILADGGLDGEVQNCRCSQLPVQLRRAAPGKTNPAWHVIKRLTHAADAPRDEPLASRYHSDHHRSRRLGRGCVRC